MKTYLQVIFSRLIFSSRICELNTIEVFLQKYGTNQTPSWKPKIDYYRLDGTVPPDTRIKLCNKFNDANNKTTKLVNIFIIVNTNNLCLFQSTSHIKQSGCFRSKFSCC